MFSGRVVIVQPAGDFAEASQRLRSGGKENYRAQRYTVGFVESLANRLESIVIITGETERAYREILPGRAIAVGAGLQKWNARAIIPLIEAEKPDRIILRTPDVTLLYWCISRRIPTLALLADSFDTRSIKGKLKAFIKSRLLNASTVTLVGNHGRVATEHLIKSGVHENKVMAWDYPSSTAPAALAPKHAPETNSILYVGMLSESKGVGDLIRAISHLHSKAKPFRLTLIGAGVERESLEDLCRQLGVDRLVDFAGLVPNDEIVGRMSAADLVIVPSRHDYAEGQPLTISEALCSRTPLIVSDHPMFSTIVTDEVSCLKFPGGDADRLGDAIDRLTTDTCLYAKLSANSLEAWTQLQIKTSWGDLIDRFLAD